MHYSGPKPETHILLSSIYNYATAIVEQWMFPTSLLLIMVSWKLWGSISLWSIGLWTRQILMAGFCQGSYCWGCMSWYHFNKPIKVTVLALNYFLVVVFCWQELVLPSLIWECFHLKLSWAGKQPQIKLGRTIVLQFQLNTSVSFFI